MDLIVPSFDVSGTLAILRNLTIIEIYCDRIWVSQGFGDCELMKINHGLASWFVI